MTIVTLLLFVLVPFLVTAFFGVILFILISGLRSGSKTPLPLDPAAPVRLYARVSRPGYGQSVKANFDRSLSGMLTVAGDQMYWEPDEGERWAAPVNAIAVRGVSGANSFAGDPSVEIEIAGSGLWRLVVSDRPINRFMGNDFKRFREARRAREFAALLVSRGARG